MLIHARAAGSGELRRPGNVDSKQGTNMGPIQRSSRRALVLAVLAGRTLQKKTPVQNRKP